MSLQDNNGVPLTVTFPDVPGEAYRRMWEERDCSPEIAEILKSGGILLFIHADTIRPPKWVVDEVALSREAGLPMPDGQEVQWHPMPCDRGAVLHLGVAPARRDLVEMRRIAGIERAKLHDGWNFPRGYEVPQRGKESRLARWRPHRFNWWICCSFCSARHLTRDRAGSR
jgi:hypothetical protein